MDPVKVRKFAIYTAVNIAASAVDFSSFIVLTHLFGAPTLQSIAAYSASILVNYCLQRRFVFVGSISGKSEYRVFMEFVGTGMFGLASTALVIWLCIGISRGLQNARNGGLFFCPLCRAEPLCF
jgi:putative flippase GtrA